MSSQAKDLVAIAADDALLDLLGGPTPSDDDEFANALAAWRRDVDAEADRELVDTDTAVAVIRAGRPRRATHARAAVLRALLNATAGLVGLLLGIAVAYAVAWSAAGAALVGALVGALVPAAVVIARSQRSR